MAPHALFDNDMERDFLYTKTHPPLPKMGPAPEEPAKLRDTPILMNGGDNRNEMGESESSHEGTDRDTLEPIAVVGLSLRFPDDATSPDLFWKMMMDKKCASRDYPADRMNIDAFYSADDKKSGTISTKGANFIKEDIRAFDAPFFQVPPQEAGTMDPQHRGLLETTYQALENAGIPMGKIAGSNTAVHVGCFTADFITMNWRDSQQIPKYSATGTAASILANRLSWFFDLRGPSMTVDTACSSGMVAMDQACGDIWSGRSDTAIVAGANIIFSPELNIALSNMNFLSPDAKCFSFDHRANGYARGEGFGVLILKPLSRAIKDGDTIRALVRSVGVNQDGRTNGGITQPSRESQSNIIRETYRKAGLDMKMTRFFEAHGTGTPIGDPIEVRALGECFKKYRSVEKPLYVGAVKSNVGHLEGSSGIAGMIKAIMALEKGIIPPNTNFDKINPHLDAEYFHIKFPLQSTRWPCRGLRRASVNSFGFGGTNGHVILDDAAHYLRSRGLHGKHCTVVEPSLTHRSLLERSHEDPGTANGFTNGFETCSPKRFRPKLMVWSAADKHGLERLSSAYSTYVRERLPNVDEGLIDNLAFTLNTRRSALAWRSYAIVNSSEMLLKLGQILSDPIRPTVVKPRLGFLFTGQGAQWCGMGRELFDVPVFRASLLRSQACLKTLKCGWLLLDELCKDQHSGRINDPEFSQTLCTAIQIALIDLYESFGINPSIVVGHSSGEISAAYCAGMLDQDSAMRVAYYRGILSSKLAKQSNCSMMSVGLSPADVNPYLLEIEMQQLHDFRATDITISCINSPKNVTLSGPVSGLDKVLTHLQVKGIFARRLKVDLGYHSPQMKSIASAYLDLLQELQSRKKSSRTLMFSSVTCDILDARSACSGQYWVQNMTSPVRFSEAMTECCFRSNRDPIIKKLDRSHEREILTHAWLEIGPHSALRGPIREILKVVNRSDEVTYDSALARKCSAFDTVLNSVGRLHCQNVQMDLGKVDLAESPREDVVKVLPDLPPYPFNHSTLYWEEPQSNKNLVFRDHASHDLLGAQVIDWNPMEAKWIFIIKAENLPWIKDHKINGSILYPAAGMLAAAVEAVKLLMEDKDPIGYEIKDAKFNAPLLLNTSSTGTETQISLNSPSQSSARHSNIYSFRMFTRKPDEAWEEICSGSVRADLGRAISDVDEGREGTHLSSRLKRMHAESQDSCSQNVEATKMYRQLSEEVGIEYGPSFQVLDRICWNDEGQSIAHVKCIDEYASQGATPPIVHPTTLDGLFQLMFVALTRGGTTSLQTMVPTRIGKIWISQPKDETSSITSLQARVDARLLSRRSAQCDISALDPVSEELKIHVEDLETTAVSRNEAPNSTDAEVKRICHHMVWKPDLDILDTCTIQKYSESGYLDEAEPTQWFTDLELLTLCFGCQALDSFGDLNQIHSPILRRYASWLQEQVDQYLASITVERQQESRLKLHDQDFLESLCERVSINKRGQLHVNVGYRLKGIFAGDVDPLQFLFETDDILFDFYTEMIHNSQAFTGVARYLESLVHKDPALKFVEVGAGTGGTTDVLLKSLVGPSEISLFEQYMFTDISPAFLDKARDKFSRQKRMDFGILDLEKEPTDQGMNKGEFDVLIASLVFHAMQDLSVTIQRARKLLKPGGKLIFMELTAPEDVRTGFVFGLLPGWWQGSESFRQQSPCISEDRWDEILKNNGFSGNDLVFRDYQAQECRLWNVIISTATKSSSPAPVLPSLNVILDKESDDQRSLANRLVTRGEISESPVTMSSLGEASLASYEGDQHHIVLLDYYADTLGCIGEADFAALQKLITTSASLIWVMTGGGRTPQSPHHGLVQGLSRVCRNENPKIAWVNVSLETHTDPMKSDNDIDLILKVIQKTATGLTSRHFEPEYMEMDGLLHINRLVEAVEPNKLIFSRTKQPAQIRELDGSPPLKLNVKTPGLLDSLEWVENTSFEEPLAPDRIEIEVQAIGVNFKECLIVLGRVNTDKIGSECAGAVVGLGEQCTQFQIGDRVVLSDLDCYKTRIRVKEEQVVKISDSMSFVEAASIPTAFSTAFYSLCDVGRLQKGESVLIHAASGGTGQAAIQVAAHVGAEIFATVGSAQKKKLLMEVHNVAEDHIFYSRDTSFADGIRRMTKGRGVDVILNSLSGDGLVASWECIAPFGRFLEIGRKDIDARGSLPMHPFLRNASFMGVDLAGIANERTLVGRRWLQKAISMFEKGKLKPPHPLQTYQLEEAEKAFRFLQSGKSSGKVVLEVKKTAMLPIVPPSKSHYSFHANKTYVIAGGSGGIGRSIARWLVHRGAKNLLLLSRSGPSGNKDFAALIEELREKHIHVESPSCDITNLHALQSTISHYSTTMPPIKGCFQASMVLRDATFTTMSHPSWHLSLAPKVHGSWNLHLTLPPRLDFFILLSSVCGIFGNGGQANYAAGNTFLDALAQYRVSRGEKATALDLGIILGSGFVAENEAVMEHLMRLSLLKPISGGELWGLLDLYCDPRREYEDIWKSQVVTGLELPADQRAKGKDILVAMQQPLFSHMHAIPPSITSPSFTSPHSSTTASSLRTAFLSSPSPHTVASALRTKMSRILGIDHESIQLESRVESYGVDSLVAVELRNWLSKEVEADVAVFELLGAATLMGVGRVVVGKTRLRGKVEEGGK